MSNLARFEAMLRKAAELEAEVRVVPSINQYYGDVEFYAHIVDHDSDTIDISISGGPALTFLELQRSAEGLRGDAAKSVSDKAANFTRQPLSDPGRPVPPHGSGPEVGLEPDRQEIKESLRSLDTALDVAEARAERAEAALAAIKEG